MGVVLPRVLQHIAHERRTDAAAAVIGVYIHLLYVRHAIDQAGQREANRFILARERDPQPALGAGIFEFEQRGGAFTPG